MTFVLMLAATAAAAVAVGLLVYWLTVLALRTLDRLAPYWYVRYVVAGPVVWDGSNYTSGDLRGSNFSVTQGSFTIKPMTDTGGPYDWQDDEIVDEVLGGGYVYTFDDQASPAPMRWGNAWPIAGGKASWDDTTGLTWRSDEPDGS